MTENEITYIIRGVLLKIHQDYGPGMFERVYEAILVARLRDEGLEVQSQVPICIDEYWFKGYRSFQN